MTRLSNVYYLRYCLENTLLSWLCAVIVGAYFFCRPILIQEQLAFNQFWTITWALLLGATISYKVSSLHLQPLKELEFFYTRGLSKRTAVLLSFSTGFFLVSLVLVIFVINWRSATSGIFPEVYERTIILNRHDLNILWIHCVLASLCSFICTYNMNSIFSSLRIFHKKTKFVVFFGTFLGWEAFYLSYPHKLFEFVTPIPTKSLLIFFVGFIVLSYGALLWSFSNSGVE